MHQEIPSSSARGEMPGQRRPGGQDGPRHPSPRRTQLRRPASSTCGWSMPAFWQRSWRSAAAVVSTCGTMSASAGPSSRTGFSRIISWSAHWPANTHGLVLGNYRVLDRLGSGGMGVVYLAEHCLLKRRVAVKVLRSTTTVRRRSWSDFTPRCACWPSCTTPTSYSPSMPAKFRHRGRTCPA